jgi:hypothetical protein
MGWIAIGPPPESRWDRIRGSISRIHPLVWAALITGIFGLPAYWLHKQAGDTSTVSTSGSASPAVFAPGNGNSINVNVGTSAPLNAPEDAASEPLEQEGIIKTAADSFYDAYYRIAYSGNPELTWPETSNAPTRQDFEIIEQRPNGFRIRLHTFSNVRTNGIRWKAVGIRAK